MRGKLRRLGIKAHAQQRCIGIAGAVQAFDLLAKLSQQQNLPLHRVARDLVETDHPTNSTF